MPRIALLEAPPTGYGLLTSNPPQSILTKSAPCLAISIARSVDFSGRLDVKIMTYSIAHEWTTLGRIEVTSSSVDPFVRRVPLADDVLYACAVLDGSSELMGSVTMILDESFARPTDSGLLAVVESAAQADPIPQYLTPEEGDARYDSGGEGGAISEVILDGSAGVDAGGGAWTFALGSTPTRVV